VAHPVIDRSEMTKNTDRYLRKNPFSKTMSKLPTRGAGLPREGTVYFL
jgi:hypothetical protein